MEIMRSHVISYGVIEHELKLGISVLEEDK